MTIDFDKPLVDQLEPGSGPLVDRYARPVTYLRLSVTDRCNFRCLYCMPEEGVILEPSSELLTFEEIERVVAIFTGLGVRRVRITGGEPLVRRDLPDLVGRIGRLDGIDEVVLTTNGYLLPRQVESLWDAGLREVTVSLDSLHDDRFSTITRGGEVARVLAGMDAAKRVGLRVKVNTVVIRGVNDDEIVELADWATRADVLLRFIEFMPIGSGTIWGSLPGNGCVPAAEIRARLAEGFVLEPLGAVRGAGPSRYLRLGGASMAGRPEDRIGVISAVTECFCADCNRIRLTPQGGLRACLADDRETDLRGLVRGGGSDEEVEIAVRRALFGKRESHTFDIAGGHVTSKRMVSIGG